MPPSPELRALLEAVAAIIKDAQRDHRRQSKTMTHCFKRQLGANREAVVTQHLRTKVDALGVTCTDLGSTLLLQMPTSSGEVFARVLSLRPERADGVVLITNPKKWLPPTQMALGEQDDGRLWGTAELPWVLGHTTDAVYFGAPDYVNRAGRGRGFRARAVMLGCPLAPAPEPRAQGRDQERPAGRRRRTG